MPVLKTEKRLPSWDVNASVPSMIRLPGAEAMLTRNVSANVFFETLKEYTPVMFDVLCSDKI